MNLNEDVENNVAPNSYPEYVIEVNYDDADLRSQIDDINKSIISIKSNDAILADSVIYEIKKCQDKIFVLNETLSNIEFSLSVQNTLLFSLIVIVMFRNVRRWSYELVGGKK